MTNLTESLFSEEEAAQVENFDGKSDVDLISEHAGRQRLSRLLTVALASESIEKQ
ncbi:MAG: hypothetical protein GY820_33535 [Gammaproteobacteria bacterium]|nr:hypothetical protein [Gammaproteobacteria bacterium]